MSLCPPSLCTALLLAVVSPRIKRSPHFALTRASAWNGGGPRKWAAGKRGFEVTMLVTFLSLHVARSGEMMLGCIFHEGISIVIRGR